MKIEFEMTDLGELRYFHGSEFVETSMGMIIHQHKYVTNVFKRLNMLNCNSECTPMVASMN